MRPRIPYANGPHRGHRQARIIVLAALLASAVTCMVFLAVHAPLAAVIGAPGAIFLGVIGTGVNVLKFLTD